MDSQWQQRPYVSVSIEAHSSQEVVVSRRLLAINKSPLNSAQLLTMYVV